MATIPVPALHTAPIQQEGPLQMMGQMMGIKSAQQEQQARAQQMQQQQAMAPLQQQSAQLELQQVEATRENPIAHSEQFVDDPEQAVQEASQVEQVVPFRNVPPLHVVQVLDESGLQVRQVESQQLGPRSVKFRAH